ncbi:Lactose regulatory protein LAC9 like [Verticillium longisporum]|uniref:Lactose regulatory protein LAC9 like n=1 Tax=Verticillium longisporum TaxID=100787 RepID=A0A8I3AFN0_VERLO|nr:Lactose regulatory protein LAC9 like [Verticillium longisporum]
MSTYILRQDCHRRLLPTPADRRVLENPASACRSDLSRRRETRRETRRQAPAACQECRKQKTKCSAHRPKCLRCQRLSKDCIYDTDLAETPRQSLRRKYGELETRIANLEHLFGFLQNGSGADVAATVRRIREGADLNDLGKYLRDGDLLLQLAVKPGMN